MYQGGRVGLRGRSTHVVAWRVLAVCTHGSSCRGETAVGSRCRSSWIMASTSFLVRMPLRSSSSTKAAVSHMLE